MFSSENEPEIGTVSNASEFFTDTLNMWDNDDSLVYRV
jgi:hypothetical protein